MKNLKKQTGLALVFLITLCSCSNENVDLVQLQLLRKVVEVSVDGTSSTTILSYNGNKIVSIDEFSKLSEFFYTGDLITKIVILDKTNQQSNTMQYFYADGQLIKITSSENYAINYVHGKEGSVAYEKLIKDAQNNDVKVYHGKLHFQNGNLVKDERTLDDAGSGVLSKKSINLDYDYKKNALSNILGFNKLLNYSKTISTNNSINKTEVSEIKHLNTDQVISAINVYKSKCEYDSMDYPVEIVSENLIFGGNDSNHLKSLLFYN